MHRIFVIVLLCLAILSACREEPQPLFFNNKGVLSGVISLNNLFFAEGISISLKGANYDRVVVTEEFGDYIFTDIPTSNLQMEVRKEGYGSIRVYNIVNSGLDTVKNFSTTLFAIPEVNTRRIRDFNVGLTDDDAPYITLNYEDTVKGVSRGRIFFSLSPDVSNMNYEYSQSISSSMITQTIGFNDLAISRFSDQKKVYFRLYPNGGGGYFDYETDRWVYSAVNVKFASGVFEFSFPR